MLGLFIKSIPGSPSLSSFTHVGFYSVADRCVSLSGNQVVLGDVAFALLLGFLPFSLGRILLCCTSCFSFGTVDAAPSYTSTATLLLVGYGFILMVALLFTAWHTFQQYSRGERPTIAIYFGVLTDWVCWLSSPLRMLPSIHGMLDRTWSFLQHLFWGIKTVANASLNLAAILVICPLFFGWLLDICTSKLFGVEVPQKLQLLYASSFASTALHWLIGWVCLKLHSSLSSLHPVCRIVVLGQTCQYACCFFVSEINQQCARALCVNRCSG